MAVMIGSARIDENGRISGGKPGDQTGKEVGTQSWYKHSKGWRVLRCKDALKAEKIAQAMQMACDNNDIGYSQANRNSLWNNVKSADYNPRKTTKKVDTDCSALVRLCCAYAGIMLSNFTTSDLASVLLHSGAFTEMKDDKYTTKSDYLRRGDVLVTKVKGHTAVVLTSGRYSGEAVTLPTHLQKGDAGERVKELQQALIMAGYALPKYGADGDFGTETENAVKKFQTANGFDPTGIMTEALIKLLTKPNVITIAPGKWNVRTAGSIFYRSIGTVSGGETYSKIAENENGWVRIFVEGVGHGWISPKAIAK